MPWWWSISACAIAPALPRHSGRGLGPTRAVRSGYGLILTNLLIPRFLVLVLEPPSPEAWLSVSPEQLVLRRSACRCLLAGLPESENESSVTVQVPRANLFDVAALTSLMQRINEGGLS